MADRPEPDVEVAVLGAGAAGLAAADALLRAGLRVRVLEARARIGGRLHTRIDPVTGVALEAGAEFVHGRPPQLMRLARRAGARVRSCWDRHAILREGRLEDGDEAFEAIAEPLGNPELPRGITAAAVLDEAERRDGWSKELRALARNYVNGFYAAPEDRVSAHALSLQERAQADLGGITPSRVIGGYAQVLDPLKRRLDRREDALWLSAIVEEVRWRRGEVTVRARSALGTALAVTRARALVVTLPIGVLQRKAGEEGAVRFTPRLPAAKRAAFTTLEMGALVKVALRLRRPLWADVEGARRRDFFHAPGAAVPVWWTLSPLKTRHLVGWAAGSVAARIAGSTDREVLDQALESLARLFQLPRREVEAAVEDWHVENWSQAPFTGGGYCVVPAGAEQAPTTLAAPVEDTLFFAGEATHDGGHAGTVHGALDTGWRAAREVVRVLRRR